MRNVSHHQMDREKRGQAYVFLTNQLYFNLFHIYNMQVRFHLNERFYVEQKTTYEKISSGFYGKSQNKSKEIYY